MSLWQVEISLNRPANGSLRKLLWSEAINVYHRSTKHRWLFNVSRENLLNAWNRHAGNQLNAVNETDIQQINKRQCLKQTRWKTIECRGWNRHTTNIQTSMLETDTLENNWIPWMKQTYNRLTNVNAWNRHTTN
jgi:hypothetical protein